MKNPLKDEKDALFFYIFLFCCLAVATYVLIYTIDMREIELKETNTQINTLEDQ